MTMVGEAREEAVRERFVLKCLLAECSASFEWSRRSRIDFADKSALDCSVFAGFEKDTAAVAITSSTMATTTSSPCLLFLLDRSFYLVDHTVIGRILLPKLSSNTESGNNAAATFIFGNDLAVKLHQKHGGSLETLAKFVYYVNNALTSDVHVYKCLRVVAVGDERALYSDPLTAPQEVAARLESLLGFMEKAQTLIAPIASADSIADSLMRCGDGGPLRPRSAIWDSGQILGEVIPSREHIYCFHCFYPIAG